MEFSGAGLRFSAPLTRTIFFKFSILAPTLFQSIKAGTLNLRINIEEYDDYLLIITLVG